MENQRATFGSKLGVILVSVGSAVGLGNIWRFPYIAGEGGGGAFLIIYLLCLLIMGIPVLTAEFFVGKYTHLNAVGAYRKLAPRTPWVAIGYNGVLAAFLIYGFYSVVAGWTLHYIWESATGALAQFSTPAEYEAHFNAFVTNPWKPTIATVIFMLVTHAIIMLGVQKGIERSSKLLMPLLFVILLVLCGRSISMEGGMEGLKFLFTPDFSKVTSQTFLNAVGQSFFSISAGLGCMIVYASYFSDSTKIGSTAVSVALIDTLVAVLAAVMIFPAVFSVGIQPTAGPSLVFITLPNILNTLSFSWLWSTIFFLLLALAALTSTISIHEVVTAYVSEQWNVRRNRAAWLSTGAMLVLGIVCSLSFSVLSDWTIGGRSIFDFFDYVTANFMLPIGGIFTCLFVGWKIDQTLLKNEITNYGTARFIGIKTYVFLLRWIAPMCILLVLLNQLGIVKF